MFKATKQQMFNRQVWLAALRLDNGFEQAHGQLFYFEHTKPSVTPACCCLGVAELCRLDGGDIPLDIASNAILSHAGMKWLGLEDDNPAVVYASNVMRTSSLNDNRKLGFREIADVLAPYLADAEYDGTIESAHAHHARTMPRYNVSPAKNDGAI